MEAEERGNGVERVRIRKTPMQKWRRIFRGMQATVVRFSRTPVVAEERGDPKRVTSMQRVRNGGRRGGPAREKKVAAGGGNDPTHASMGRGPRAAH